jgi:hypothetical protein
MSLRRFSPRMVVLASCASFVAAAAACGNFSGSDTTGGDGGASGVDAAGMGDGGAALSDASTPITDSSSDASDAGRLDADAATALVFITSKTFTGRFAANAGDALAAADQECQTAAQNGTGTQGAAGRTFMAWLSQSGSVDARQRLFQSAPLKRTYVLPNNVHTVVFPAGFEFGSGDAGDPLPKSAINVDENGKGPSVPGVWTGTLPSGLSREPNYDCQHWTADMLSSAAVGSASTSSAGWTNNEGTACSVMQHLYCFEAP